MAIRDLKAMENNFGICRRGEIVTHYFLVLLLLSFFGLNSEFFTGNYTKYLMFTLLLVLWRGSLQVRNKYSKFILIFSFFVLMSCLYSSFLNNQKFHIVLASSYHYFSLLFFCYLVGKRLTYMEIERVIKLISITFCLAYIIQWLIYPVAIFTTALDTININDEVFRLRMPGSICCYCLFFYGLNRFLLSKRIEFVCYMLLGIVPILIQGFRSLIFLTLVSFFVLIIFVYRRSAKIVVYCLLGIAFVSALLNTSLGQQKMNEMLERQNSDQTFDNADYVRYLSFDYYWNYQFNKPYEKVIGGGVPSDADSRYYKQIESIKQYQHLWWMDLGLVGLVLIIGIPAVLLLVSLYVICIWRCKAPRLQFIRFTLLVVLLGSIFTSMELYRNGNILIFSLLLYSEYIYNVENPKKKLVLNDKNSRS